MDLIRCGNRIDMIEEGIWDIGRRGEVWRLVLEKCLEEYYKGRVLFGFRVFV